MKLLSLITLFLVSTSLMAKDCKFTTENYAVGWKAFKTPLKIGVGGKFTSLGTEKKTATSLKEMLEGVKFDIDTTSTKTGNEGRDKKIIKFFFNNMMESNRITGETLKYEKKILTVRMSMNKYTRDIPLKVENDNGTLVAKGVIDVLDFGLNKSLTGINKACEELHEGKTWSDVEVSLTVKYSKTCK